MKFRNGLTNIGVMCGFATSSQGGCFDVHQCSAFKLRVPFIAPDYCALPRFPYEPVTVVYRILPPTNLGGVESFPDGQADGSQDFFLEQQGLAD